MSEKTNGRRKKTYIQQFRKETIYRLKENLPIGVTESPRYGDTFITVGATYHILRKLCAEEKIPQENINLTLTNVSSLPDITIPNLSQQAELIYPSHIAKQSTPNEYIGDLLNLENA